MAVQPSHPNKIVAPEPTDTSAAAPPSELTPRTALGALAPLQIMLIGVGVLVTLIGQVWLYVTPIDNTVAVPTPVWLSGLGIVLFAVAPFIPGRWLAVIPWGSNVSRRSAWILSSLLLSITAAGAAIAFERYEINQYLPILSLWILGIACYVIAMLPARIAWPDVRALAREHWREALPLVLVQVFAVALRFYELGDLPMIINGDEGLIGMFAQATSSGALANPFSLWENIGILYMQMINVALRAFGPTPFALRLLPAIGGSLAIFATYLFARQIRGQRIALLAVVLLSMSHIHLHFSRTAAVTYIQGTWLVPLEFYLLLSGLTKRSSWRAALGGVLLAVHMDVYITAQIVFGILLVYTAVSWIMLRREAQPAWRQWASFWGGFAITVIPQVSYMARRPEELLSRLNAEGTFNSGWLANEIAASGKSAIQILAERVMHAFLSLIYYPAVDFYGSPAPVLSFVAAVLFLLGLGYMLVKFRTMEGLLLNGYFWGMTVAVGVFAIPPAADSYRMIVALPAAMTLAAIGLDQVLTQIGLSWANERFRYGAVVSVIVAGLTAFNIWIYFFDFVGRCRYGGDPQTRFASYLGTTARDFGKEGNIYLLSDATFFYGSHASVDFLTQGRAIVNVPDPIDTLQAVSGETIIASPPRIDELLQWTRANPGGDLHYQRDCSNIILLAYRMP